MGGGGGGVSPNNSERSRPGIGTPQWPATYMEEKNFSSHYSGKAVIPRANL